MATLSVGGWDEKHRLGSTEGVTAESVGKQRSRSSEMERLSGGSSSRVFAVSVRRCVSSLSASIGAPLRSFPLVSRGCVFSEGEGVRCEDGEFRISVVSQYQTRRV